MKRLITICSVAAVVLCGAVRLFADTVYVSNYGNNTIEKFTPGGVGSVFANTGDVPTGLAFDSAGNLYAATYNGGVKKYTPGGVSSVFVSPGLIVYTTSLAFDSAGNLYAAAANNGGGTFTFKFTPGGVGSEFVYNNGWSVRGMAFDSAGNLYETWYGTPSQDYHDGRIVKFTPDGTRSDFVGGLNHPYGLAFDSTGNLYAAISDYGMIEKFSVSGGVLSNVGSVFASALGGRPTGLAFDSAGNLYVANYDLGTIEKFSSSGADLGVFASGLSEPTFITVQVPEPDTPPIADAGSDQTVMDADDNGSEKVTLDGSGSSDSDGTIVSWVWTDDLGNTIPDGEITTAILSVGTHTITLTVTDDDGLTDANTVTVIVEPFPNQPPVANADGPYTIYVGDTLTLNAIGSTDYDNDIVSYLWDLDDNNSFETDAGNQPVFDVNFAYLQSIGLVVDNTYNINLKVTDSVGQSDVNVTTLTIIPQPTLLVYVDIKPGSCPNPVNVKSSGVLPVAILGTADFDITTIDPTSIRLAGVEPLRSGYEDVAAPVSDINDCNCTSDGPDGLLDLTLKFRTQKIVEAIGDVNEGDVLTLDLTGVLIGERPIEGTDCILIRGKHKPFHKADLNKDGVVNSQDFAIFAETWLQSSIAED